MTTLDVISPYRDSSEAEFALAKAASAAPAYWTSQTYSNQFAGNLLYYVNRCGGVEAGARLYANEFRKQFELSATSLDWLIPLNEAAIQDMLSAYEICGTFRDAAELRKRAPGFFASPVSPKPFAARVEEMA